MLLYGLSYHYVAGRTFFKGIEQEHLCDYLDLPGKETHARLQRLCHLEAFSGPINPDIGIADIAKALYSAVERSLNEARRDKVSLSITGGVDSRILLSILMKLGVEIHGYTYGDPEATDCLIGKEIASLRKVKHVVYDIRFDKDTFGEAAEESIRLGDSLCSLHRAHRVEAIKPESEYADTMFLGTMGGEFIKGANHDDYIVSDFIYEYAQKGDLDTIFKHMKIRRLKADENMALEIKDVMDNQSYIKDKENMELHALVEIAAKLHHGQNLIQFSKFMPHVFTPYCDQEYLRVLFSSKYNFLYRRKTQSPLKFKIDNPRFGCLMQKHLDADLAKIPYANGFSAREYLISPFYAALKARFRKRRIKNPPTFPLGKWMEDYVKEQLQFILDSRSFVCEYFDISQMLRDLNAPNLPQTETFWLKYTCPIQMYLTNQIFRNPS
jgi:hypothetical protein